MAERNVQIKLLSSNISNRPLPTNLLLGEAVVNTADGIVMFSGSSQGANGYEQLVDPSIPNATGGTYFEVGSNLYNLKIRNKITQYNGLSDLSGKFLSGTSEGFVLADISDIVTASNGLTDDGNNIKLGGILSENTVISGGSQNLSLGVDGNELLSLNIRSIQALEKYKYDGLGLEVTKNPGTFKTELDYTSTLGYKTTIYQNPSYLQFKVTADSGDTESELQLTSTGVNLMFRPSGQTGTSGLFLTKDSGYYFADGRENTAGIEYLADYSTGWTDNSLVTKKYVDDSIATTESNDTFVTGGTYDNATGDITFTQNDGSTFAVDLSALDLNDTVVTGGTISYVDEAGTITFTNSDGSTFDVTGITDVQTTGGTFDNATGDITFTQNNGSTFTVDLSALDLNDTVVTGGTISYNDEAGTITFTNSDGSTFDVTGITDVQTTGATLNGSTATFTQNDGSTFDLDLSALEVNDTVVTGGTISYVDEAGTITFTNNDGATFDVTGITDVQTTGATLNGSTATFTQNDGSTFDLELSALDVNDTFVTGFTYDNANTLTISRNEGEADLTVNISTFTGITISTLDANSIVYTDGSGKLTTEGTFSYDAGTDTMTVGNITVQNGSGSTATFGQGGVTIGSNGIGDLTVQGDLTVLGTTTTISTTELVVEDPTITVNYSTGTTDATSLGAGIEIQDGDGAGTNLYLKVEELNTAYPSEYTSLTGAENRALYTSVNDIVIRQATDISSPAANQVGKRVLAEDDILDSGSY